MSLPAAGKRRRQERVAVKPKPGCRRQERADGRFCDCVPAGGGGDEEQEIKAGCRYHCVLAVGGETNQMRDGPDKNKGRGAHCKASRP